jgi:hypothetical protein
MATVRPIQSRQRRLDLALPFSLLLSLNRPLLSLALQSLPWKEKLLHVSRLSSSFPPLNTDDFRGDRVVLMHRDNGFYFERYPLEYCPRVDVLCSSPRLQRLLCGVEHLAASALEPLLAAELLRLLSPPSLSAPSTFSRLRSLQLWLACQVAPVMDCLASSAASFPSLEALELTSTMYPRAIPVSEKVLTALTRLPRLRSLSVQFPVTVDAFLFLCSLPLATLKAHCDIDFDGEPKVRGPLVVAGTWEALELVPKTIKAEESAQTVALCEEVLTAFMEAFAAPSGARVTRQPTLHTLTGGWRLTAACLAQLLRMLSLVLSDAPWVGLLQLIDQPDLSPLYTADLQPLLPLLHTFYFPHIDSRSCLRTPSLHLSTRPLPSSRPTPHSSKSSTSWSTHARRRVG